MFDKVYLCVTNVYWEVKQGVSVGIKYSQPKKKKIYIYII